MIEHKRGDHNGRRVGSIIVGWTVIVQTKKKSPGAIRGMIIRNGGIKMDFDVIEYNDELFIATKWNGEYYGECYKRVPTSLLLVQYSHFLHLQKANNTILLCSSEVGTEFK